MKISVIIPVYNSMRYLRECVTSITSQTYRDIEVLLVNDGSTDGSGDLCDALAREDSRVVAIHQPNGGTSAARNMGLERATGDYITFTDNDDFWERPQALEELVAQLAESDADMVLFDCTVYWQDTDKRVPSRPCADRSRVRNKPASEAILHLMSANIFSTYCVWGKLIRASIIRENGLRFPVGMRNEDIDFCGDLFRLSRRLDWYNERFYVYRKGHEGAQTKQRITYGMLNDLKTVFLRQMREAEALEDADLRRAMISYLSFPYAVWMGQSKLVRDERVSSDVAEMKRYRHVLRESTHPSVGLVRRVCGVLGFSLTSSLLAVYLRKRNHLS
ncbi:MAG: glycosyltransferase [Ruminococcaceae bacterium]|nr:glycosyltransferase [Oscillospiraceae bacterium]